jgi:hypothetical protein
MGIMDVDIGPKYHILSDRKRTGPTFACKRFLSDAGRGRYHPRADQQYANDNTSNGSIYENRNRKELEEIL